MDPASHQIARRVLAGHETRVLKSSAAGGIEATFVPDAGMVCCSLRHCGEELLGQRGGLQRYVAERGTMGIPLLHPWANRLSQRKFSVGGQVVDVDRAGVLAPADSNGLPIHGMLAGHPGWHVLEAEAGPAGARLRSSFDFTADPELLAAFPFPHELDMDVTLCETTLTLLTTLRATGRKAVPVSFGYHPYLRLPGAPREEWAVELPTKWHLVVDRLMIPTGEREPATGVEPGPLGARTFDDDYVDITQGSRFVVAGGGRRIEVVFEAGYPVAVVYAPGDDHVVCFEPMTSPTNALISGDGLKWAQPGESHVARFAVSVGPAAMGHGGNLLGTELPGEPGDR